MSSAENTLPTINLSGYINPKSSEDRAHVIAQVREACEQYGFFQIIGHGVPWSAQQGLSRGIDNLFNMPKEDKMKL